MIQSSYIKTTALEITDIVKTTHRGVTVVVKQTGKELHLPANHVDFMPGLAIIPAWLFNKIYGEAIHSPALLRRGSNGHHITS